MVCAAAGQLSAAETYRNFAFFYFEPRLRAEYKRLRLSPAKTYFASDNGMARILYIAYPLLTVSDESAGGAEQVLWTLEREMARSGMLTTVAASAGSCVSGEHFSTGEPCTRIDDYERRCREHEDRVVALVRKRAEEGRAFDLVHDMSGSFWKRAAEINVSVLATLHLPRSLYPAPTFQDIPANVSFNCVSGSQSRSFVDLDKML